MESHFISLYLICLRIILAIIYLKRHYNALSAHWDELCQQHLDWNSPAELAGAPTGTTKVGHVTNNHQEFLLLFDDLDLKNGSQARDVSQRVLDDVQSVQPLLRSHQDNLHNRQTHTLTQLVGKLLLSCIQGHDIMRLVPDPLEEECS